MDFNIAWRITITAMIVVLVLTTIINLTPKGWPKTTKWSHILVACILMLGMILGILAVIGGAVAMIWTY